MGKTPKLMKQKWTNRIISVYKSSAKGHSKEKRQPKEWEEIDATVHLTVTVQNMGEKNPLIENK